MTDALTGHFKCKVCNKDIEYNYPNHKNYYMGELWDLPRQRKYFLAKARMEHNLTHKGDIEKYV